MARALELAGRGWGRVHPNPLVGAVLLDAEGRSAGEGFHAEYGGPHAEVQALNAAGAAARGGTMYVTLEPCSHHGRTPPCTDAILAAGVRRVVFGARDPNIAAAGGAEVLRSAGVEVVGPVAEAVVHRQNAGFFLVHQAGKPFIALKLAVSLDGRLAAQAGQRTLITGPQAQEEAHRLRAGYQAIVVGRGTALVDDPLLTVRGALRPRVAPARVVLDSELRLPLNSQLIQTIAQAPVIVIGAEDAPGNRHAALHGAGVTVKLVPRASAGLDLDAVSSTLWDLNLRTLFCEGGARLAGAFMRTGRVQRLHLFVAPHWLGPDAVNAFDTWPTGAQPLALNDVQRFGNDVLLTYEPAGVAAAAGSGSVQEIPADVYGTG